MYCIPDSEKAEEKQFFWNNCVNTGFSKLTV